MSAADRRKAQNKGVKGGTIRKGAGGKFIRRYNAKTGRWDVVSGMSAKTGGTTTARREKGVTKPAVEKGATKSQTTSRRRRGSDSIQSIPVPKGTTKRTAKVQGRPRDLGGAAQLVTSKDGTRRWVKKVTPKKDTSNIPDILKLAKQYDDYLRGRSK